MKSKTLLVNNCLSFLLVNALTINQKINFNLANLAIEKVAGYDLITCRIAN